MTTVTLNVFSGRPNPAFQLDDKQTAELTERVAAAKTPTDKRPSGAFGGLGYRGFTIERPASHPLGALALHAHEGLFEQGIGNPNLVDESRVEHWLATLAAPHVAPEVLSHVQAQIERPARFPLAAALATSCPVCHAADAPNYNPGPWNTPAVQPYNNCYNYANDHATNTFAQPGRATGHQATVMDCAHVQPGAVSDGLHAVANFSATLNPGQGWYVALVIWPGADYHWYRQDKVGCWSHKPGSTAARNVDNAGHAITDPKTCNRGPYTVFCSYMVASRATHIR